MSETADTGAAESPVRSVGEQILDSVRASLTQGDTQIVVRLRPPELGAVVVRFRQQGEHVEGTLEVAQSDTRRQIEQALPEVIRSLQEAGIPLRRLDVLASDSPDQAPGKGLPQQDAWSGPHGGGQNREHLPASHTPWPPRAADQPIDVPEPSNPHPVTGGSPGRIDVLL